MQEAQQQNWFYRNPRKARWLVFALCFAFLELSCRLLVATGLLHHETYPTTEQPVFWAYIDPVVGMWRYPNKRFNHATDCFDVDYETNSVGARDPERALESPDPRRVVVLGDSFVEGHGVARADRLSDLLESRTGVEHLNFGTSGSFGTIQEWLFYQEYASKYDHSDVIIFILPANDFDDNDINEWGRKVYRPYLREADGEYEVYYPVTFENRATSSRSTAKVIKNTIENNVYLLNAIRWGIHIYKENKTDGKPLIAFDNTPTYSNYSAEDFGMMKYALGEIARIAADRNVYLFTIPTETDAKAAQESGYRFPLVDELNEFANGIDNVQYIDLLPSFLQYMQENNVVYDDFTLGCNSHWGALGNKVAADVVYEALYKN